MCLFFAWVQIIPVIIFSLNDTPACSNTKTNNFFIFCNKAQVWYLPENTQFLLTPFAHKPAARLSSLTHSHTLRFSLPPACSPVTLPLPPSSLRPYRRGKNGGVPCFRKRPLKIFLSGASLMLNAELLFLFPYRHVCGYHQWVSGRKVGILLPFKEHRKRWSWNPCSVL